MANTPHLNTSWLLGGAHTAEQIQLKPLELLLNILTLLAKGWTRFRRKLQLGCAGGVRVEPVELWLHEPQRGFQHLFTAEQEPAFLQILRKLPFSTCPPQLYASPP